MISAPSIGESWMDTYIDIRFKGNGDTGDGVRDKVHSELLRMIQPTQEEHINNNTRDLEPTVSITFLVVMDTAV